jgi:hypothetical protein
VSNERIENGVYILFGIKGFGAHIERFRTWYTMLIVFEWLYNKDNKSCERDSMGHKICQETALRVHKVVMF